MTMNDGLPAELDTDPFLVVASLHGTPMQITAGSVLAAATAVEYWRALGVAEVDWFLRADLVHPSPVLLFTRRDSDGVVHATELVAGKSVSSHAVTCCKTPLREEVMRVCTPDMAKPCPACLDAVRSAGLFSALGPRAGLVAAS
ncbi:MAG: hypothetical protein ACT4NY_07015 [Pseudonocardiales bacterium]